MADAPKTPQPQLVPPQPAPVTSAPVAPVQPPAPASVPQQQPVHVGAGTYGPDGRLTVSGMKAAIAAGGSVLINGKTHTTVDTLPTAADLAQTPEEKDAARRQLEAEQRRIQEQLNALKGK